MAQSVLVVLLEQNPIQREGILSFLRSGGFTSFVECSNLEELSRFEPDKQYKLVFLIDFDHARASIGPVVKDLHSQHDGCVVIVLSEQSSAPLFLDVMRSEADGLFLKQIEKDVLIKSLELVLLGERVFPAKSVLHLCKTNSADESEGDLHDTQARVARLSAREREVLLCLEAGHSNKMIARSFGITESTVKVHVKAILRKILVKNRTQAAVWAKRMRLGPALVDAAVSGPFAPSALNHPVDIRNGAFLPNDQ